MERVVIIPELRSKSGANFIRTHAFVVEKTDHDSLGTLHQRLKILKVLREIESDNMLEYSSASTIMPGAGTSFLEDDIILDRDQKAMIAHAARSIWRANEGSDHPVRAKCRGPKRTLYNPSAFALKSRIKSSLARVSEVKIG
jgi:hypothetical protein